MLKDRLLMMASRNDWDGNDIEIPSGWTESLYSLVRCEIGHSAWFSYDSIDEKWLTTSPVLNYKLDGDKFYLHTKNSIYTFDVVK